MVIKPMPEAVMEELKTLPGIKESELREMGLCAVCGEKLGAKPHPLFYRVTVEVCGLMLDNIRRQNALGEMIGNGGLAMIMGPDKDMAKIVSNSRKRLVHFECAQEESVLTLIIAADEEKHHAVDGEAR